MFIGGVGNQENKFIGGVGNQENNTTLKTF
jgi:hypothetical protein